MEVDGLLQAHKEELRTVSEKLVSLRDQISSLKASETEAHNRVIELRGVVAALELVKGRQGEANNAS